MKVKHCMIMLFLITAMIVALSGTTMAEETDPLVSFHARSNDIAIEDEVCLTPIIETDILLDCEDILPEYDLELPVEEAPQDEACELARKNDEIPDLSYSGHTYRYIAHTATFDDAEAECEAMGGHLATITSAAENAAITEYLCNYYPGLSAMIGLFDAAGSRGSWSTWVTGEAVKYTNWGAGQPDWESQTICVINTTASSTYGWEVGEWDNGGNGGYHFLCEWDGNSRKSLAGATIKLSKTQYIYDGKAKKPSVTVELNGKTLEKNTDYKVTYKNNTNIGTATVKVTGVGNYKGSASATFRIVPATPKLTANITKLGGISMRVNSVKGATGYEYCLTNKEHGKKKTYKTGKKVNVVKKPVQGATYAIQVRAYKKLSNKFIYGDYSELKEVRVPVYRALLIGQNAYPKDGVDIPLHYCIQNAKKLKAILTSLGGNQYQSKNCKVQTNRTRSEMIDDIGRYLGSAQEGDVSLFYYSGHGMDGAGSKSHGGLNGVDGFPLQPHVLAEELGKVKGTVIVILDSCHSGAHIEAGFLDDPRFIVITAAKASQNAAGGTISGYKASLFMYFLAEGLGCGYTSGSGRGYDKVPADDSGDGKITLLELARYINKQVEKYKKKNPDAEVDQTVQFSPRSGTIIFRRE